LVGTGGARRVPIARGTRCSSNCNGSPATGDGPPRVINVSLGGFLLLFVASRVLYLVLIDPVYVLAQPSDELYIGTIAHELVTGPTLPFAEYRTNNYALGTLVIGALTAGFFELFGPIVFALKLAPLLVSTLTLVFWYWTTRRYAGERVAGYIAILFCVSPPLFTAYSVAALGDHSQSIVFSALTVFLLFRMLSEEKPSRAYPVLLGLTAGVGLWFAYIYGLTLLAMLVFWLWHDKGVLRRPRVLWFALGFLVGFSPWIVMNLQTDFAGLVIYDKNVWEHFGLKHLWDGLAHPRTLALYEFFATIASNDDWDLYRRAVNLLYSLLFLGPIMTAGVLHLKTERSAPAEANYTGRGPRVSTRKAGTRPSRTHPTQPTLVGFGILYVILFALAVQFSDFRAARYHVPVYPFLFLFAALALARCQDQLPRVQRQIQAVFMASVVVLGLGTHAPLVSLDRPGSALSAKGYSYVLLPWAYLDTHAPAGPRDREFILQQVQRPHFSVFLSDFLSKVSSDDQGELARAIAVLLAESAPLNGRAENFAQIERVVPPGFERYFYFQLGSAAVHQHRNELPKAVAAVEFLRHRSPEAHHLALVGIYRWWPWGAALDRTPEALANTPASVAPELVPHYWRAIGDLAGRYWYDTDQSLSLLNAHLHVFVPRLDPAVQRYVLQGVGEFLYARRSYTPWVLPAELERFPQVYQPSLLEGWGMALGEAELYSPLPWTGHESLLWLASTKGLSTRSLVSVQQGKAHFDALFEGLAPRALEPPRSR
jgi:4-amino-4-deoxy-L-arabinose transferase-like glycosyltransferase